MSTGQNTWYAGDRGVFRDCAITYMPSTQPAIGAAKYHSQNAYLTAMFGQYIGGYFKPRSHLADLTADLSRPWWSGEVLWSRRKVGKERGWVLEGPGRSVNLVELSPTVPGCFELFKTIGSGREWWAVVDRALGSRVRSLEGRWVSVSIVGKGRAWSGRNQDGHCNRPTTTE